MAVSTVAVNYFKALNELALIHKLPKEWVSEVVERSAGVQLSTLAVFLVLAHPGSYLGRFCTTLHNSLKDLNLKEFSRLIPELTNNSKLSESDVQTLNAILRRFASIGITVLSNNQPNRLDSASILGAGSESEFGKAYSKQSYFEDVHELFPEPTTSLTLVDSSGVKKLYIVSTLELIKSLSTENPVNPATNEPLPIQRISELRARFQLELKLA